MILEICGSKATIETDTESVRPKKSEVMELICDNSLARELMGWEPKYSLQEGLEETVAWMRDNMERYKTGVYNVKAWADARGKTASLGRGKKGQEDQKFRS